jgi:hypothetical protein
MTHRLLQRLGGVLLAATFVWGCEDVITVDLNSATPGLVIEGRISNDGYLNRFYISRSTDFYNPTLVDAVSDATIIVSDDIGNVDTLLEARAGEYFFTSRDLQFEVAPGRIYQATVKVEGETYTASTTMPEPIRVDSLRTEYQEGGGIGTEEDEGYRLHVYFRDAPDRPDYARIKLSTDGHRTLDYYLYDGRYSDGNAVDYEYFFNVFQPGERVIAELHAMDRTMYYYFLTLSEVWASEDGGNFLDATPANPNTNWSGGALGYFGAFSVSSRSIVVPEFDR